jgi:hypothetical protein
MAIPLLAIGGAIAGALFGSGSSGSSGGGSSSPSPAAPSVPIVINQEKSDLTTPAIIGAGTLVAIAMVFLVSKRKR